MLTLLLWTANIILCLSENNSSITTTNSGELFATINPDYQTLIQDLFLPDGYILPNNIYLWNVSEIVYYINQSDPQLLYIMDTAYLIEIFPEYFLKQLPREIIVAHELYYLLPSNDTSFSNITNITHATGTCTFPFVETKHDTYFTWEFEDLNTSFACGLLCEYGDVLWGIDPQHQHITDIFLYVCSIMFLLMIIISGTNQCMDIQLSNQERCCRRGFLFHAPICLIFFYAFVAICFLVPLAIGKENLVCVNDIDDNLTVSMKNPGGSMLCTIVGSLFYAATLLFGLYTMGFTFVLWRQFFSPLQSLWSKLRTYTICCPCRVCVDFTISPIVRPCLLHLETTKMMSRMSSQSSSSPVSKKKKRKLTYGDIFCSATSYAHYILWLIAIIMTSITLIEDSIDAFTPLGICTAGGQEESSMIKYNIIPFTIVFLASTIFVPFAIYLLWKVNSYSANEEHRKMMTNLGRRILWYFLFQEICWIFVCEVSWVFYDERPKIIEAAEERMFCLTYRAKSGDVDKCYEGFSLWYGLYIQMALTLPLAGIGSIFLSCHSKNKKRWKIICAVLNDCIRCRKYVHQSAIVDRLHGDASEIQSSRENTKSTYTNKTHKTITSTTVTGNSSKKENDDNVPPDEPQLPDIVTTSGHELVPDMSPVCAPVISMNSPSDDDMVNIQMADL
eukprot:11630_1